MVESLKITRIGFHAGSAPGRPALDVETPNVTVLVGPNNSGKSQALREIEIWCQGQEPETVVIDGIHLNLPDQYDDLLAMLEPHKTAPPRGHSEERGYFWIARPIIREGEERLHFQVREEMLRKSHEQTDLTHLRRIFVRIFTLRLDGRTRFDLVDPKNRGDLIEEHPQNHLWALFTDEIARGKVRRFTEEAFAKHFVIDPTKGAELRVRLSDRAPNSRQEEQGLDITARNFHKQASLISELGDGVQTSVGLVSAVMSLPQRILLIDEPEAFLHPTLARRVGRTLAATARERDASLVTATHSAEFLYGCMQADPGLRIVRLTFDEHGATARSIEPGEIKKLMQDPLLRSANALRALFHRGVVVTEADSDRAFYDEINHRLLRANRGIEDGLFMNAQNWQTIPEIAQPLRQLGIPAAAIFDFDVLKDKSFKKIWPLLNAAERVLQPIRAERTAVKLLMESMPANACKKSGINAFDGADKGCVNALLAKMAEFGIFFVPVGELECWLAGYGVSSKKATWVTKTFRRLGSDPNAVDYVHAGQNDVWGFIEKVETWIANPTRKGIPTH